VLIFGSSEFLLRKTHSEVIVESDATSQLFEKLSCLKRYGVYHFTKEPYPFSQREMCVRKLYIVLPFRRLG